MASRSELLDSLPKTLQVCGVTLTLQLQAGAYNINYTSGKPYLKYPYITGVLDDNHSPYFKDTPDYTVSWLAITQVNGDNIIETEYEDSLSAVVASLETKAREIYAWQQAQLKWFATPAL